MREMQYKTKMYKRKSSTYDSGTMGFHDYETRYVSIDDFFKKVNEEMDELNTQGAKKISVQYLKDNNGNVNEAIVTYLE